MKNEHRVDPDYEAMIAERWGEEITEHNIGDYQYEQSRDSREPEYDPIEQQHHGVKHISKNQSDDAPMEDTKIIENDEKQQS